MRIGVVTIRQRNGEAGGAERFFDGLVQAFQRLGHAATELTVYSDESTAEGVKRSYLQCYDLDLTSYDMVVSTKAPTWLVRHPRHVCYLVHTMRVFYDMFDTVFPSASPEVLAMQRLVHDLDSASLSPPRCQAVFSIGEEVSRRLREANGIEAPVLHPPLWSEDFREGNMGDYFFLPGRLHPWKRVDLVIEAFRRVPGRVRLVIAGTGEAETALHELAQGDARIEFLGRVDDARLMQLYSGALAVPFAPKREDYGYVTLEAFASGKPVVTCTDSGEAAAIVAATGGGLVVAPTIDELAAAMRSMTTDAYNVAAMGQAGGRWVRSLSWERIAEQLVAAGGGGV
jgi:glycosyltransferase involved in cell wall biosynthesis